MKITDINELSRIANDIRINILKAVYNAQSGHTGGSLSCADILTVLYFNINDCKYELFFIFLVYYNPSCI